MYRSDQTFIYISFKNRCKKQTGFASKGGKEWMVPKELLTRQPGPDERAVSSLSPPDRMKPSERTAPTPSLNNFDGPRLLVGDSSGRFFAIWGSTFVFLLMIIIILTFSQNLISNQFHYNYNSLSKKCTGSSLL